MDEEAYKRENCLIIAEKHPFALLQKGVFLDHILVLLPVVVDVLYVVMLGTKSPVGRFRNPLKIKHFQDLRLSKVANSVLLVCHSSSDKIKYS